MGSLIGLVSAFIAEDGSGYAQQNFKASCSLPSCSLEITKEALAVQRLITDIAIDLHDAKELGYSVYVAYASLNLWYDELQR
jgi:hypothetical protein